MNYNFKGFLMLMLGKTSRLKSMKNYENENSVSLDFYDDIKLHLEKIGIDIDDDRYNNAYDFIEKEYIDYLKNL
ncbi:hypothetical protein [Ilyobacter sp.]|uniref:hypothetical protein n=1 Tax=Ilyobacter sp. TaxID=3100343 RepID=UPI0035647298